MYLSKWLLRSVTCIQRENICDTRRGNREQWLRSALGKITSINIPHRPDRFYCPGYSACRVATGFEPSLVLFQLATFVACHTSHSLSLSLYTCQYPIKGKKCHKNTVAASLFEDDELICQSETFTSCEACLTLTYHHTWEVSSKTVKVLTPSSEFLLTFCLPFFVFSLKITCIRTFPFSCKAAIFICTEIKLQRDKNWRWPNVESPRGFGLGFLVPLKTTVFFRLCVSRLCLSLSSSIMRVPVHSSSINKWFSQFGVEAHSPDLNPIRHL